ncbi:DUF928 domain-containing protein [Coleofasciculus sp.]|uniref:DUF928 domain-containing protein n=1 Tax=Coleofasciculus sp. TaxID=3100458 RepID=UPI0039F8843E
MKFIFQHTPSGVRSRPCGYPLLLLGMNGIAETGIGYSNKNDSEATMHSTSLPFLPLSLVIGLLTLTPGYATEYQPPSDRGRQQQADAQGSRRKGESGELYLLIPENHTPNTVAAHPTFFFYTELTRVTFVLSAPGVSEPIYERDIWVDKPQVVWVKIPETAPPLEVGKEYVWTVVSQTQSTPIYARASLRRVEPSPEFNWALSQANSNREQAEIFAQYGLWHDALAAGRESDYFWQLLAEIGRYQGGDVADVRRQEAEGRRGFEDRRL